MLKLQVLYHNPQALAIVPENHYARARALLGDPLSFSVFH